MESIKMRKVTLDDWQIWLNLAHESDKLVSKLVSRIDVFFDGFDKYMSAKIKKNEAYMAVNEDTDQCLGIVAFSKTYNGITFFAVSEQYDLVNVGSKLIEFALKNLDDLKPISTNVLNGNFELLIRERQLYQRFGFVEYNKSIIEGGVPATMLKLLPKYE